MSSKTKWIIAVLALIGALGMFQVSAGNIIYMPYVSQPWPTFTPTSTATATLTPTVTLTPTATRTPTRTSTPDAGILLVEIVNPEDGDPLDEYVSLKNYGSSSVDMTGWFVRDDGPNKYTFPDGFDIGGGKTIRIYTKWGVDTSTTLYWGRTDEVWNDGGDCAYLRDDSEGDNVLVDVLCYSLKSDGSMTVIRRP